ncbi:MAG: serine/threonine-protein kinase [Polyangiales bacterium]
MSQPAETLADRWTLVEKIDEGAMGEIFRATHAVLGHAVAVKVLNPTVSRDKASTERFLREARIAARLQHRNVVRVEDFGVAADGRPFLVMELLRGESLARRLARAPRPTHAETLDVIRQIAAGLDAAHAAGIVHRDLKPENVFLAQADGATVVKVLDFGVAKFTDALANGARATASNTLIGTPRYMSPEQARSSRELDGRSDLWALGMIAYEMLTGAHPFEGEAIAELLVAILTHRIAPPTSVRPGLPAALDAWAAVALARSRYERFPTGRALADALADALDGRLDERWSAEPAAAPSPRGGTVRVPRAAVAPAEPDPLKRTPVEGPAPVTVPVRYDDRTPPRGLDASSEESPPSLPPARPRASWLAAVVVAVVAASALVVGARTLGPRAPSARAVTASLAAPTTPAPPTAPAPAPGPVTQPAAPVVAPPAAPVIAEPALAEPSETRRHRRHRGHRASLRPDTSPAESSGSGLYDPPGI